jgi:phenylacetate-CoA ligase
MLDGIRWPAVLTGRAATLASMLGQFERSQWLPAGELEALQLAQLGVLLAHAGSHAPWYRDRLGAAGIAPGVPLTRALWERIPVLERAEVQERGADLRSDAAPQPHGSVREIATSGSTGRPIRVLKTELTGFFWDALTLRAHDWGLWNETGILAAIKWFPDGVAAWPAGASWPNWGEPYSVICDSGPSCALAVTATVAQQAEWLGRVQPDYLTVFPSILPDLIGECAQHGVQLTRLKQVRTIGECLDPAVRVLCRERWNVPVQDTYSAQEVGYMALQCPAYEHYHVQSECVRIEVLDEQGRACGPGETGRVVVTPLHNFAMPLVRYAIGDYAEVGAPCACGRGLPVLERILGRSRNMLALPGGERLWPRLAELRYNDVFPVKQFQVVQTGLTSLQVLLVAGRKGSPEEEGRLRAIIVERMGYPFEVSFSYVADIPRSAGGKFEDFKSELRAN